MAGPAAQDVARAGPFISYSRRDLAFARRLCDALRTRGRNAWIDLEGIEPSEVWLEELREAIDAATAVVVVISPDSVSSRICGDEVRHAVEARKKLIPLLYRPVDPAAMPEALARLHWIHVDDESRFDAAIDALERALDTDFDWTQRHTRLLVRAREWAAAGRDRSLLLRGSDLAGAEQWLLESGATEDRRPAALQAEFIGASAAAARRSRNRLLVVALSVAVVLLALAAIALYQRDQAIENERQAVSRQLAAQAQATMEADLDAGMLLAVAGYRTRPTFESRQALARAMRLRPHLQRFFHGHTARLQQLSFDATRSRLASAATDGRIIVWQVADGKVVADLREGNAEAPAIAISPDGRWLAHGTSDGGVRLRTLDAPEAGGQVSFSGGPASMLAFSADGRLLAVGGGRGEVSIHDARTGTALCTAAAARREPVTALRFGPSVAVLAIADYSGSLRTVDAQRCVQTGDIVVDAGARYAALSATLDVAVATDPGIPEILVIDARTGASSRRPIEGTTDFPLGIAIDPSGTRVALATGGGDIALLRGDFRRVTQPLRGHRSAVTAVVFDAAGEAVASGSLDGTVILWDLTRPSPIEATRTYAHRDVSSVSFADSGEELISVGAGGDVAAWSLASGSMSSLPPAAVPAQAVRSVSGDRIAWRDDGAILVHDLRHGTTVAEIPVLHAGQSFPALSRDGWLLGYLDGGQVRVRNLREPADVVAGEGGHGPIALTSSGDLLAYAAGDEVTLFDVTSGDASALQVTAGQSPVQSLALSPDARLLATGGTLNDGEVVLWDLAGRRVLHRLTSADQLPVAHVFFAPDGALLAAITAFDERLYLWDVATGQLVLGPVQLAAPALVTRAAAFSPDGAWLATAEQGGVILRDLTADGWVEAICRAAGRNLSLDEWRTYAGPAPFVPACP